MTSVGRITKASGTLLRAQIDFFTGDASLCVSDAVFIGEEKIPGLVAEMSGNSCLIVPYASAGGICCGDSVSADFSPPKSTLGPGFPGGVFDALLQPLDHGDRRTAADERVKIMHFDARMKFADRVSPGDVFGYVQESGGFLHKVKAAPGVSGTVVELRTGYFRPNDRVGKLKRPDGSIEDIRLYSDWVRGFERPHFGRLIPRHRLFTRNVAVDGKYPIMQGFSVCSVGGDLMYDAPFTVNADICVYVACGTRTADVRRFANRLRSENGAGGMPAADKTVLIASRAGESALMHEAAVYNGITLAEYFRDMGMSVLFVIDSLDEFAESLRKKADFLSDAPCGDDGLYGNSVLKETVALLRRAGSFRIRAGEGEREYGNGAITIFAGLNGTGAKGRQLSDAAASVCDVFLEFGGKDILSQDKPVTGRSFTRHVLTRAERQSWGGAEDEKSESAAGPLVAGETAEEKEITSVAAKQNSGDAVSDEPNPEKSDLKE